MGEAPLTEWLLQASNWPARGKIPISRWLVKAIRDAILSGRLQPGQKLPPTRELARDLGVARITTMNAYESLVSEGYLHSRTGAGTFVGDTRPDETLLAAAQKNSPRRTNSTDFTPSRRARQVLAHLGASSRQLGPFTPGIPDVQHFPHKLWQRLLTHGGRHADHGMRGYGATHGLLSLRRALAEYLALSRGVRCLPEQIVITHGAHQAIDLCVRAICDPGDLAWIEDPGYWGARNLLTVNSVKVQAIPVDAEGLRPPRLLGAERPKLIFVTPSHQYPSGVVMSLARRRLLVELAARWGSYIIEDDYDSEFRYGGTPLPSLQGLDPHERTLYIGSFSKTLYPGLRLGFVVAPPAMAESLAALQSELNRGGQLLVQAALAEFISGGHFGTHIRRMRAIYEERQSVLTRALRHQLGDLAIVPEDRAGLHLAIGLKDISDVAVEEAAAAFDLVARPLSRYFQKPASAPQGLVLGFGGIEANDIEAAVLRLARAIDMSQRS